MTVAPSAASSLIAKVASKLYVPSRHLWYRPCNPSSDWKSWLVEVGLTDRGLQDLGDVESIQLVKRVDDSVHVNQEVLKIHWDGHIITAADELYHTVWENVSGVYSIPTPARGTIDQLFGQRRVSVGTDPDSAGHATAGTAQTFNVSAIDEDDILMTIRTDAASLQDAIEHLVDEEEYERVVRDQPPGAFHKVAGLYR